MADHAQISELRRRLLEAEREYERLRRTSWHRVFGFRSAAALILLLVFLVLKIRADLLPGFIVSMLVAALLAWEFADWLRARKRARNNLEATRAALKNLKINGA